MNGQLQPNDDRLRALLREARPAPPLPPRFQESVWRRIERQERSAQPSALAAWLDTVAGWVLRPRLALAGAAAMLLLGVSLGALQGQSLAHETARQQYLAAVSPLTAR